MATEPDDINKLYSQLNRIAEVKECFYHKKDECGERIINAHSISRGNRLELIKGLVNNNEVVYALPEVIIENGITRKGVKPVGWGKVASTFYGFCNKHDSQLFKPIEDGNDFDKSAEHCFLHSYRSFAYTYHSMKKLRKLSTYAMQHTESILNESITKLPGREQIKEFINKIEAANPVFPKELIKDALNKTLIPKIQDTFKPFGEDKTQAAIKTAREQFDNMESYQDVLKLFDQRTESLNQLNSRIEDGNWLLSASKEELKSKGMTSPFYWITDYKILLDSMIENGVHDGLKYYCKVKDTLFPFACAFAFSPDFLYSGMNNIIMLPSDPQKLINACLMVTILPDKSNKTIILFSCFNGDPQSIFFLNKLFSLQKEEEFERAVTSLIINKGANVFLNPEMWNKLGGSRQSILEGEINVKRPTDELPEKPFMSELNFFSPEFARISTASN